jgi:8-oxo-dGTP diphosphatase
METDIYESLVASANQQGIKRYVVGAVIVNGLQFLLLQRKVTDFMGDIYELPSGKVEEGEQLDKALYREVKEETNLKISEIDKYIGYFDYFSKNCALTRQFNFIVFVVQPFYVKLSEHQNFVWVNKEELEMYSVSKEVQQVIEKAIEVLGN